MSLVEVPGKVHDRTLDDPELQTTINLRTFAILGVILGIIAVTGWVAHRRYELRAAFDKVHLGASKSEVVRQLGRPWKVSRCGVTFGDGSPPGCAEEVIYRAPSATRIPRYWSFQFDAEGKLMSKWEDLSP